MFENIMKLFKKGNKHETLNPSSRDTAKERLHLVLMQDRANVSADFLDLMRQEIIEVIKKYIDIDESAMDVRLTNQANEDGTQGAPALYANIPILNIKDETRSMKKEDYIEEGVKEKEVKIDNAEEEKKEYETVKLDNKEDIKDDLNNQTDNKKQEESKDKIEVEVKQDNAEARTEEEKIIEEEQKIEEAKKIVEENLIEQEKSETAEDLQ